MIETDLDFGLSILKWYFFHLNLSDIDRHYFLHFLNFNPSLEMKPLRTRIDNDPNIVTFPPEVDIVLHCTSILKFSTLKCDIHIIKQNYVLFTQNSLVNFFITTISPINHERESYDETFRKLTDNVLLLLRVGNLSIVCCELCICMRRATDSRGSVVETVFCVLAYRLSESDNGQQDYTAAQLFFCRINLSLAPVLWGSF